MSKNGKSGNWFKKHKVLTAILAFIILCGVIGAFSGNTTNTNDSNAVNNSNEKEAKPSQEEVKTTLASRVEKEYLEFWGVNNLGELRTLEGVSLNTRSISAFEDYGTGNVLVNVQEDVNQDEAKEVGKHVMGAVGLDIKDLDFIVVRGTDGRDVNTSRGDIPALRQ